MSSSIDRVVIPKDIRSADRGKKINICDHLNLPDKVKDDAELIKLSVVNNFCVIGINFNSGDTSIWLGNKGVVINDRPTLEVESRLPGFRHFMTISKSIKPILGQRAVAYIVIKDTIKEPFLRFEVDFFIGGLINLVIEESTENDFNRYSEEITSMLQKMPKGRTSGSLIDRVNSEVTVLQDAVINSRIIYEIQPSAIYLF